MEKVKVKIEGRHVAINYPNNTGLYFTARTETEAQGRAKVMIDEIEEYEENGIIWRLGSVDFRLPDGSLATVA